MVNLDTLEKVEVFKDLDDRRLSSVTHRTGFLKERCWS